MSSLAFFIGCVAVGEGLGRFGAWVVFTDGDGAGRGGGRRGICAFAAPQQKTRQATTGMKRTVREITLASNIRVHALEPTGQPPCFVSARRRIAHPVF